MAEIDDLNVVDASNTARWPEGMAPATINNSARADEGLLARWFADTNGSITSGGSSNAYTITSNRTIAAYSNNRLMAWTANHTNTDAATLNLNGIGAKDIKRADGTALAAGDIVSGQAYITVYKSSPDDWFLLNPSTPGISAGSASQAEMEAGTSTIKIVTPGRQHFHPGHPKAGGNFDGTGTPAFRAGDYGMGAITDNGTGNYTLNLDTAFDDTDYWLSGFARSNGDLGRAGALSADASAAKTSSTIVVTTARCDGSAASVDTTEVGVNFWGDYA